MQSWTLGRTPGPTDCCQEQDGRSCAVCPVPCPVSRTLDCRSAAYGSVLGVTRNLMLRGNYQSAKYGCKRA